MKWSLHSFKMWILTAVVLKLTLCLDYDINKPLCLFTSQHPLPNYIYVGRSSSFKIIVKHGTNLCLSVEAVEPVPASSARIVACIPIQCLTPAHCCLKPSHTCTLHIVLLSPSYKLLIRLTFVNQNMKILQRFSKCPVGANDYIKIHLSEISEKLCAICKSFK